MKRLRVEVFTRIKNREKEERVGEDRSHFFGSPLT
jgi:hypothetical protein